MAKPHALILRAPGTNCNDETAYAFEMAGAASTQLHVNRLVERPEIVDQFQIFCVPGGFSYGDDLGAGRLLAHQLDSILGEQLRGLRDRGGLVIGICNGFQTLLRSGLLVEPDASGAARATLAFNRQGRYEDRWVRLAIEKGRCAFLPQSELWEVPVAHAEGNFTTTSADVVEQLRAEGRIAARYVDEDGAAGDFPINPNGSTGSVAGLCDATGRVFAMMPHPERHLFPHQHPAWTRRKVQPPEGDGARLFRAAVGYFN